MRLIKTILEVNNYILYYMYNYAIQCTIDENEIQSVQPTKETEQVRPVIETGPTANSSQVDATVPPSKFDPFKVPYQIQDKVKEKFKNYFGGREKFLGIGGAAAPPELIKFLSYCFEGLVQEGYTI